MMNFPLKNWLWGVNLFLLAVLGYSGGKITSDIIGSRLESQIPKEAVSTARAEKARPRQQMDLSAFQAVLNANIFDARRSALSDPRKSAEPAMAVESEPAPLALDLAGVMIYGPVRLALIRGRGSKKEDVFREGDCVPAGGTHPVQNCNSNQGSVNEIRQISILVEYRGKLYTYEIENEYEEPADTGPPKKTARSPARNDKSESTAEAGGAPFTMNREGNTIDMTIPNSEVDKAFENFAEILKQARVVPYTSGDLKGFQIRRIQPGSVFERIGLKNMDVIRSVNGQSITTADQALGLMNSFRNESEVVLEIRRSNSDLTLNYTIE
ncbi:MAG: PDZ domain-containing protein [Deltaproteobacteria bacterium]|nr:PDZ domain-containing protein [Deltaproteobacteria bacterium]